VLAAEEGDVGAGWLSFRSGWRREAVTLVTSLEAAGGAGNGPMPCGLGKRTSGAMPIRASAAVTTNRPITGTAMRDT
jgi:hypothetical protein